MTIHIGRPIRATGKNGKRRLPRRWPLADLVAGATLAACAMVTLADAAEPASGPATDADPVEAFRAAAEAAVTDSVGAAAGDALRARLPVFKTTFGPARDLYILEGDLLADEDDVDAWRLQQAKDRQKVAADAPRPDLELKVNLTNGVANQWPSAARNLRYAVLRASFPDDQAYRAVVDDMAAAGIDWADLCSSCGITFVHRPEHDGVAIWQDVMDLTATDELRFVVVYEATDQPIIASAFFPTDTREERIVRIYPQYFQLTDALTGRGVLRHELGHILGYRHEHIDEVAGCAGEDGTWRSLTPYDPRSVMHYFCGGGGSADLSFSASDRDGHRKFYALANQ